MRTKYEVRSGIYKRLLAVLKHEVGICLYNFDSEGNIINLTHTYFPKSKYYAKFKKVTLGVKLCMIKRIRGVM